LTGGLNGDSQQLQMEITSIPSLTPSQAIESVGENANSTVPPSDVRTVTYRIVSSETTNASDLHNQPNGLVRGEWERATYAWMIQQGQSSDLDRAMKVIASEVENIEFTYFDDNGTTYTEWDSIQQGTLPTAVKVAISVRQPERKKNGMLVWGATESRSSGVYEALVYLPNAHAESGQASASSSTNTSSSTQKTTSQSSNIKNIQPITSGVKEIQPLGPTINQTKSQP